MEKFKVSFTADNQQLKAIGTKHASDTYADIEAEFVLGNRWTDMDSVSAVWWNDFTRIATVLDPQGKCIVPHEVLTRKGCVRVNLVGSVTEGDELKTRLTSYSAEAVQVNEKIKLTGSETSEITPSQFEQFVAVVIAEVEKVTGMTATAETLPAGSDATARYENGVLYLGIPQGIQGETGNGIASVVFNSDYSLTFNFTDGTEFTTPSIRGAEGNGIRSIAKTGTSGLVDTYTITFDDGSTTTYTVTNGAKGDKGDTGATPSFSIGTVETLEPTEDATATITGTAENPVLNLGIPQGRTGEVTYEDLESILPRDTASGQIASFPDGQSVIPLHSLKVSLEPIQSGTGTPSPDNIRPISGHTEVVTHRTGKNLLDPQNVLNDAWIQTSTGAIASISGANVFYANVPKNADMAISMDKGNRFVLVGFESAPTTMMGAHYDNLLYDSASGNLAYSFNTGENVIIAVYTNRDVANKPNWVQFELGSTATDFEPYQGDTYTTSLGQTVYGGTLDVVSGELTVDWAMVTFDGSENWLARGIGAKGYYYIKVGDNHSVVSSSILSDKYAQADVRDATETVGINLVNSSAYNGAFIYIRPNNVTDMTLASFKDWLAENTLQVVYELAEPQTVQLSPQEVRTLLGTNNVWSDGDVVVVYSADTALWIEKKLNA